MNHQELAGNFVRVHLSGPDSFLDSITARLANLLKSVSEASIRGVRCKGCQDELRKQREIAKNIAADRLIPEPIRRAAEDFITESL